MGGRLGFYQLKVSEPDKTKVKISKAEDRLIARLMKLVGLFVDLEGSYLKYFCIEWSGNLA